MNTSLANSSQGEDINNSTRASGAVAFVYSIVIIMIFGIIGNLCVIRVFSRPLLRKRSMVPFYISQSSSNIMIIIVSYSIPFIIYQYVKNDISMYPAFCKWSAAIENLGCVCNSLTCAMMMANYFISMALGMQHRLRMLVTHVSLPAAWLLSVCVALAPFGGWGNYTASQHQLTCHVAWASSSSYSAKLVCMFILLPLAASLVLYFYARRCVKKSNDLTRMQQWKTKHRMVRILCLFFFSCIIPYYTLGLITTASGRNISSGTADLMLEILAKCHVIFPPFIHHALCASYRVGLTKLFSSTEPLAVTVSQTGTQNSVKNGMRNIRVSPAPRTSSVKRSSVRMGSTSRPNCMGSTVPDGQGGAGVKFQGGGGVQTNNVKEPETT